MFGSDFERSLGCMVVFSLGVVFLLGAGVAMLLSFIF